MAYQPKNYRKFVATAATATLVASAIAPVASAADFKDVSSKYKEAVDFVVSKGASGTTATTFGTDANIKRGDAAVLLVKVLGLDTAGAPDAGFEDVNSRLAPYINALKEAGITAGKTETTFDPDAQITRGELAVWIYKGFGLEGESELEFKDVNKNYQAAVQALVANGVTTGTSSTTFGTTQNAKRGDYAIFLYKAAQVGEDAEDTEAPELEYDGSTSVTVENGADFTVPTVTATDNVDEDVEVTHVITDASGKQISAIDTKVAGTYKITYSATDAAGNKAEALEITVTVSEPATPEVTGVSAINAKTIEVEFNKSVDADTLVKDDNDVISVVAGEGATATGEITQTLSEDGKTLTLTATNIFKGDYTVKVPFEIVKDVEGKFVSPINAKVTVNDKAAPVLTAATSTIKDTKDGLKTITLTFDEAVKSIDTVKINGVNYTPVVNGKEATVTVELDATKTYNVTVVNATDAAGNVKDVQEAPVNVSVDNVAPSILSAVPVGENEVTVTLDKELVNDTLNITGKVGTFTANVVKSAEVNPENKKEYTITLDSNYLFKNGNSDTVTLNVAKDALVDKLGNKNTSEITRTVSVNKDVTAPQVAKVATSETEGKVTSFSVTYNEEVSNVDQTKASVVNSKGEILSVGSVVTGVAVSEKDAKTVVFTLNSNLAADKYSFDLAEGFVTDKSLAGNKSVKHAFTVDVTEEGQPIETTFNIQDTTAANNVITVDFGAKVKATGTGSALNPSAYQLNGVTLPSNTAVAFATTNGTVDQTKAVITLPEGFVKTNDTQAVFRVNTVQTLDNKVSNSYSKLISVLDNTAPEVKAIEATDLTKLTVTYSEVVKLADNAVVADIKDEIKLVDSKGVAIDFSEVEVTTDGKLVLTVTDATTVKSLTTVEVTEADQDIFDVNGVAQKAGLTVSK